MGYVCKGGGSAHGGKWVPKKEKDKRFIGKPGEIKTTYDSHGDKYETLIGDDELAEVERHWSDHGNPAQHINPHDHVIDWSQDRPDLHGDVISYPPDEYPTPDMIPDLGDVLAGQQDNKLFHYTKERGEFMSEPIYLGIEFFESLNDFKWCMHCHGEVQFDYYGASYSVTHIEEGIIICKAYQNETAVISKNVEDILNYPMDDGKKLREVITEVKVTERTI